VILRRAAEVEADMVEAWREEMAGLELDAAGCRFTLGELEVRCGLAGEHQAENARTAAVALRQLGVYGEAIERGIAAARWPGRLERVSVRPEIYLDGAHNPSGAAALAAYIRRFHSGKRVGLIYGAMRDKSVEEIAGTLFAVADAVIVTAPQQTRALRPEAILEMCPHGNARTAGSLQEALAMPPDWDVLFITGSLYLVGETRPLFVQ
jgi:dihydrofolate synthase / folylpolyglutamate synthase